jgi:hypothetical protein
MAILQDRRDVAMVATRDLTVLTLVGHRWSLRESTSQFWRTT